MKNTYLIPSVQEETISSSQLEGATGTPDESEKPFYALRHNLPQNLKLHCD